MRWWIICLGILLLTACNEVTGNESGGTIAGQPEPSDSWLTKMVAGFGLEVMTDADALKKASVYCGYYRKRARITYVGSGKTLFECL
jgi:hypothetical protein